MVPAPKPFGKYDSLFGMLSTQVNGKKGVFDGIMCRAEGRRVVNTPMGLWRIQLNNYKKYKTLLSRQKWQIRRDRKFLMWTVLSISRKKA